VFEVVDPVETLHGLTPTAGPTAVTSRRRRGHSRALVLAAIVAVVVVAGCASGESSRGASTTSTAASELAVLDVDAFATAAAAPDAVVVNVHVPYESEIAGTDFFIPYDQIVGHADLPEDRSAEIVLYCRSGNMSEQAGNALIAAGYQNVSHLDGGMNAWRDDGRELLG
jgi:rhodanese-related sulfurtransferase